MSPAPDTGTDNTTTLRDILVSASTALIEQGSDSPRTDCETLLIHVLKKPRSFLLAHPEYRLTEGEQRQFDALLAKRRHGEPVAYLTGEREFWSLPLRVTGDTLIPRPETERLVELALERIPENSPWHIADLGTGSGAIAIALASERPQCMITAVDISSEALAVARQNAETLQTTNIRFAQGDWLNGIADRFNMIVANPPYIATDDPHLRRGDVRFEPDLALRADNQGMAAIQRIVTQAKQHLHPSGWLLFEHGYDQKQAAMACLDDAGYCNTTDNSDYAGNNRVAAGQWA